MLIFIPLCLLTLGLRGLGEPDEGRYAEIAREMLETQDFITPRLDYIKHLHKPPLAYWSVALSMKMFGENEFAARLPVFLFAAAGIFLVFMLAKKMFPEKKDINLYSSIVLALMLQYFLWSQLLCPDMIFSILVFFSFFFLWNFIKDGKGLYGFYIFCGLSFLVKGPVSLLLLFLIYILFCFLSGKKNRIKEIFALKPLLIFLLIILPWFLMIVAKNQGALSYFLNHHLLKRFLTTTHGRGRPFIYFFGIVVLGTLPWTYWTLKSLWTKRKLIKEDERYLFLYLWIFVPLIFFSFSGSKLPGYILPVYPALAMMTALSLEKEKKNLLPYIIGCLICYLSIMTAVWSFEDSLNDNFSPRKAASIIMAKAKPDHKIVNFRCIIQGLPFYVKKRVVLVQKQREIQFEEGVKKEYYIQALKEFLEMIEKEKVWIISYKADFEELKEQSSVLLKVYWEKSGFVLFSNVNE